MLTLRTAGNFTVVRQIANHLDTDTNYVRAVIRNAYTDVILDTLDLTDKGGQRFSKNWRVPSDPSGEGFYISIVTSVYTDSGYTTKNANYGDEENTYLVADRERNFGGGMSGGGVDSRTIRRIISEELEKLPKPEKVEIPEMEKMPEMRWEECLSAIKELKTALKPEKPEKVDFQPLNDALQSILSAVNEKEVTPATDISPILEKLEEQIGIIDKTRAETNASLDVVGKYVMNEVRGELEKMFKSTTFKIASTTANMELPKKQEEEKPRFDINKLSL